MPTRTIDPATIEASATLGAALRSLRFGQPLSHRALGLVPLYRDARRPVLEYIPLAQAIAEGVAIVTEKAEATVPSLELINTGARPILILDGDEIVGGRQNRLANATVLVPPSCVFNLLVSCVEQGRWVEHAPQFGVGEAAYPSLRARKVEDVRRGYQQTGLPEADQGQVWEEIADCQRRRGVRSETGAMSDSYAQRRAELDRMAARLVCPADGPVGIIALISGHARCADIFDRSETLTSAWPRLVSSYALEALGQPAIWASLDSCLRLLNRPKRASTTAFQSAGLGTDVRFGGNGVAGAALLYANEVVHAALFRRAQKVVSGPVPF